MQKIACMITSFLPYVTGPANVAFEISKRLEGQGWHNKVFTSDFKCKQSPQHEIMEGLEVQRFEYRRSYMQYFRTPEMKQQLQKFRPDLVHAHGYRSYQTEVAASYSKREKKPLVISMHGMAGGYSYIVSNKLRRFPYLFYDHMKGLNLLKNADAIVVNSSFEREEVESFLDHPNIVNIPDGVENNGRIEFKDNDQELTILFVGRITRDRNLPLLIQAFYLVSKDVPRVNLKIVGPEESRSAAVGGGVVAGLKDMCSQLGIKVDFLGQLKVEDLHKTYRSSDIFVYTSLYENVGLTLLEAASYGLPIITTKVGVAQDLIEDSIDGFILQSKKDPVELSNRIKELLGDEAMRKRFGEKLRTKAISKYDWDKVVGKYADLYKELISAY
jgi:glycosyltransferase involved in cell wall biosynthesis